MNYIDLLKFSFEKHKSLVCLGLDPVIEDIPLEGPPAEKIKHFYEKILNRIIQKKIYPSAVKPNYAFYAQYGIEGIKSLCHVIDIYKEAGLPVILDVKRGDIDKTALAYAKESFDFFKADAVTLAPYMGYDSIRPFVENYPEKGFYILNKTSNKLSSEIQNIVVDGEPLYLYISKRIIEWHKPGVGAVVGATYPEELNRITRLFIESGKDLPLLIPGVGSQGGELSDVMSALKQYKVIGIHRINSSSAINYAYKKMKGIPFDEAAVLALDELNVSIGEHLK